MIKVLLYIWQLPQHLLGLLLIACVRVHTVSDYKTAKVYRAGIGWGISLGQYIIVSVSNPSTNLVPHEYGHSLQSRMLGPLYLIVVGLPSITMNMLSSILFLVGYPQFAWNYYRRWPESWADKLGGITRTTHI